jgi:hypothetical protein
MRAHREMPLWEFLAMAAKKKRSTEKPSKGTALPWPAGLRPTAMRQRWYERFRGLAAGMSLRQIAERLEEPYASIAFWAKLLKYRYVPQRRGRKTELDWDGVDWSKRNCDIARRLGVSGERVRQVRAARNIPPTPRLSDAGKRFREYLRRNRGRRGRLSRSSIRELIDASGVQISVGTAHAILKQFNQG